MRGQTAALPKKQPSPFDRWFLARGFHIVVFETGKFRVTTSLMDGHITFRLKQRPGYTTYYKETTDGALIVFEAKLDGDRVSYEGYCPLLLFNIWPLKLAFKQDARAPFTYRAEGYRIAQEFAAQISRYRSR